MITNPEKIPGWVRGINILATGLPRGCDAYVYVNVRNLKLPGGGRSVHVLI